MNKTHYNKKKQTSTIKEEFIKWVCSCLLVIASIWLTAYVYKTDKLPFYGSLYEREYAQMEEKYADYTTKKEAEKESIRLANQKQIEYETERDRNGSDQIDLKAILNGETP